MRMIQLNSAHNNKPVFIGVDHIAAITPASDEGRTWIVLGSAEALTYEVTETIDEIREKFAREDHQAWSERCFHMREALEFMVKNCTAESYSPWSTALLMARAALAKLDTTR
jgi:hypothetical protein